MGRRFRVLNLVLALGCSLAAQQSSQWRVEHTKSAMTDEDMTILMTGADGFTPDSGAALGINCHSGKIDVAVYAIEPRNFPAQTGQIQAWGHWYGQPSTEVRLRFDANKSTGELTWVIVEPRMMLSWQGIGMSGKGLVKRLTVSNKLLVEYKTVAGNTQVFTFKTSGLQQEVAHLPECHMN